MLKSFDAAQPIRSSGMIRGMLLSCRDLSRSHGARTLFRGLSFTVNEGERIGLIGPNGAGKTTFLDTLAGAPAEEGAVSRRKNLRLGRLVQSPELQPELTCEEIVAGGLADLQLSSHEVAARSSLWLGRTGFEDTSQQAGTLSGGWRKRLALARELARDPELLLLDEPTNHLDIEGILWLEELLVSERRSVLVVTHDRSMLQKIATRVVELNPRWPEGLFSAAGNYADFLEKREEAIATQQVRRDALANTVRREIEWLRRGPKARTTKSKARIDTAHRLKAELADITGRTAVQSAGIELESSGRKSKRLLRVHGASVRLGDRDVLSSIDLDLTNGRRIGVVGTNGSGKTTLLRLLMGEIEPHDGEVERAHGLQVARFEQDRGSLDPELSLRRALSPEGDHVSYRGQSLHVAGWAQRFLFRTEQLEVPVGRLSGGEQARILLARIMLRPADVLLLDEPTNDLDIATLEVLEESIAELPGALVLVSHDRMLLDRVSTSIVSIQEDGTLAEHADLAQWEADRAGRAKAARAASRGTNKAGATPAQPRPATQKKLSYNEKREFAAMEETILEAEAELESAQAATADPAIASDGAALQERHAALATAQERVDTLYARWAELEERA